MSAEVKIVSKQGDTSGTKYLQILIPIEKSPQPSKTSGKTLIVASTHGNQKTGLEVSGGQLTIGVTAFIPNPNHVK